MDRLLEMCRLKYSDKEFELIEQAAKFAQEIHGEQLRESGEPYYTHPESVGIILADMGMDVNTVVTGLLHDVVEDGPNVTVEHIKKLFGENIAEMVDGVTKLTRTSKFDLLDKEEQQAESLRKMLLAIAKDVRVVIVKLADRLHNMRTLAYCTPEKQRRKARETLEVYAPLAHRFGMGAVKCELENLSFKYLWPDDYKKLKNEMEKQQNERMITLQKAMQDISRYLRENGIEAQINGRPKHLYSVYLKLMRQNKSLDEIYDLIALRVIVNTVSDCYAALGIVHAHWKPVPGRMKDYISMPKVNMYRSLHTTLFSNDGLPFEVQIRTTEMHRAAEYGIAAHWMYKEGKRDQDDIDSKLAWLREALELENYASNTVEFVDNIRKDFFGDYVYVLTPMGQIIDLPTGSTPLDFAYRIHTNLGNRVHHAKINGALVKLDYKLKNNDVVEIVTSTNSSPSRDWLNIVKTQQAKAKIRQWFKKENREENIQRGKEMLTEAAKRQGVVLADISKEAYFEEMLKRFNMADFDSVCAAIGYGGIRTGQVLHYVLEQRRKERKAHEAAIRLEQKESAQRTVTESHGVVVKGEPNMTVRFGQCCNPVRGDDIFGYITRGRGVSVHRADCPNADALHSDIERIIDVEWSDNVKSSYTANIQILANERAGLLMDVSQQLLNLNLSMKTMNAKADENDEVVIQTSFDVKDTQQLESVIKALKKIRLVKDVYRVNF